MKKFVKVCCVINVIGIIFGGIFGVAFFGNEKFRKKYFEWCCKITDKIFDRAGVKGKAEVNGKEVNIE